MAQSKVLGSQKYQKCRATNADLNELPAEVEGEGGIGAGYHAQACQKTTCQHLPGLLLAISTPQETPGTLCQQNHHNYLSRGHTRVVNKTSFSTVQNHDACLHHVSMFRSMFLGMNLQKHTYVFASTSIGAVNHSYFLPIFFCRSVIVHVYYHSICKQRSAGTLSLKIKAKINNQCPNRVVPDL